MKYKHSPEELQQAVANSTSIREVLTHLNIAAKGGNYKTIYKRIESLNIDISHFKGKGWAKGQTIGPKRDLCEYLNNEVSINSHTLKKRLIKEGFFDAVCSCCNNTEWMGGPIPLELDHISGDSSDNTLSNLRLLCPNCHALTPTYRGKNIRSGI